MSVCKYPKQKNPPFLMAPTKRIKGHSRLTLDINIISISQIQRFTNPFKEAFSSVPSLEN